MKPRRVQPNLLAALFFVVAVLWFGASAVRPGTVYAVPYAATTSVSLTVCGDAIVAPNEFCDDGTNTGAYASSIASRNCTPTCSAWGPYCGNGVIEVFYGEECDDGNNTAGDLCDALCQDEVPPVTEGGGGGGGSSGGGGGRSSGANGIQGAVTQGSVPYQGDTVVTIKGGAYPGATITVLRDGDVERVVEADGTGKFEFTLAGQTPGITTFGFWASDRAARKSITYSATFQIVQNAVTTLSGILIPPTVAVSPEKVAPGGTVTFAGSAGAGTNVHAFIDKNEKPEESVAAATGEYSIAYNTTSLSAEAFHTVKVNYTDKANAELKSGYSALSNFYVGNNDVKTGITADLNKDGFVNLTDFSILLFNWNTGNAVADINTDGTVSLPDFSIMLFYWTG